MKTHILLNHAEEIFKCEVCSKQFNTKGDLKMHITVTHSKASNKSYFLKQCQELVSKLAKQKIKIYDDLLILRHREEKENIKCLFKRRFCKIDHSRFRWNKKKSDDFRKQIRSFPTDYSVSECVDNKNEDDQERRDLKIAVKKRNVLIFICVKSVTRCLKTNMIWRMAR